MTMWVHRLPSAFRRGCVQVCLASLVLAAAPAAALQAGASVINHARLVAGNVQLADASVSVRVSSNISFLRYSAALASASA
ncbi:MAG: hypothetical protein ACRERR_06145, partial [Moraxellaceae bacterium]